MTNHELINYLKNHKFFVISPHLDDAILSLGMLLYSLKKYNNGTIINVFTKAHNGPYTLSAKNFIKITKNTNADDLFNQRVKEDQKAISGTNMKVINLDLTDALFRRRTNKSFLGKYIPEFDHIYPTYRWHILKKIHSCDTALKELKIKLKKIIPPDAIVLSPFGIENHADHVISYKACTQLFKKVLYYIEFPYNIRSNNFGYPPAKYKRFKFNIDLTIKSKLAHYYTSQIYGLFPKGIIPPHKEIFFLPDKTITPYKTSNK